MAHVYHWKHGWIPLDHEAALKKAKGNHAAATRMIADAHGHGAGIHSRRDVAGAVKDLPNVPEGPERRAAKQHLADAAGRVGAHDLLPSSMKRGSGPEKIGRIGTSDEYRLPSGHTITVDHTGRVTSGLYHRDASGRDALDANPHLFEQRFVGTSMTHDDHYVLKGHKPADIHGPTQQQTTRMTPAELDFAQRSGRMNAQQARDHLNNSHDTRVQKELAEVDSIAADVVSAYHGLIPHDELHTLVMEVIDGSPAHKAATRAQYLAAAKAAVNKAVAAKNRK